MHLSWFFTCGLFIWLIMGCLHLYKPKWSSIKRERFCVKRPCLPDKMQKRGIKNTHGMADKHPRIHGKALHRPGSAPLPHPGLHDGYTRVSSGFASCFWQKKSLSWWKKKPFYRFRTCSRTVPVFIVQLTHKKFIVFYHDGYDRWMIVQNGNSHAITYWFKPIYRRIW